MRLVGGAEVDQLASAALGREAAEETAKLVAAGGFWTGRVQTGSPEAWVRILVGVIPALDLIGYKEFHRVGKDVYYHVSLYRHSDGTALGIVDGRRITSLRTSSTAALALRHGLPAEQPARLAVIGSGEEAREGLRAAAAAVELSSVAVFSPTAANREAFAREFEAELGLAVEPRAAVADALSGADAAYVATAATDPVLGAADVAELDVVLAVGATAPQHRELNGDVVSSAAEVIVDCEDATAEPGDMRDAVENFGWQRSEAKLLGDWLAQTAARGGGPVLFKSIGSTEQDLVLAGRLLREAERQDLGQVVEPVETLRVMR